MPKISRGARPLACAALMLIAATSITPTAAAQDVSIDRGYLTVYGLSPFDLRIGGTRAFTFMATRLAAPDAFGPAACQTGCLPGAVLDLGAVWRGSTLKGAATLDGVVHPLVGEGDTLSIEFTGSMTLPPFGQETSVAVPCGISGAFTSAAGTIALGGTGTANVSLVPGEGVWLIGFTLTYAFGPILPDGWAANGTAEVPLGGTAMATDGMFVVGGTADFWGPVDGGHLAWTRVSGDSEIIARVRDQSSTHQFAKAGVMMRQSTFENSAHVILDLKPDGELEFMMRPAAGDDTQYILGAVKPVDDPWLRLVRTGDVFTASMSGDGVEWTTVGSIQVRMSPDIVAALVVSSHDFYVRNTGVFDEVTVLPGEVPPPNLLFDGGFESGTPPSLGPWWTSDHPYRQTPAKRESHQPRTGAHNAACWTPAYLDCGVYTEVSAPRTGTYRLTVYATADRPGGLVGANRNGALAATAGVEPRDFGDYSDPYVMTFHAGRGDTIRVWMYSPAIPGYVVIDDVSLTFVEAR